MFIPQYGVKMITQHFHALRPKCAKVVPIRFLSAVPVALNRLPASNICSTNTQ